MLGVEQSPAAGASELDAPLNVPGVETVEEMRLWATSAEATHDYMKTSPDTSTLFHLPPSSRAYGPLHSPPSLGPIHSRVRNESMVRARFAKVVNELLLV